jgi:hypothetical protein
MSGVLGLKEAVAGEILDRVLIDRDQHVAQIGAPIGATGDMVSSRTSVRFASIGIPGGAITSMMIRAGSDCTAQSSPCVTARRGV